MNDIAKLLSGIGDTLAGNTANPFEAETFTNATRHIDNINELKDLSNDDDSFTNEQLKDEFNNLLTEFLTDENGENQNIDIKQRAEELSEKFNTFLEAKGIKKGTKEWLQNYNAAITNIKTSELNGAGPELGNALRGEAVKQLTDHKFETPRDQSRNANEEWGESAGAITEAMELSYEHTEDKVRENKEELNTGLEKLKSEIGEEGTDKNNEAIKSIIENFGSIENFNQLVKGNGINYQIEEKDGKYFVTETDNYNSSEVEDKEGAKEGLRGNIDSWNQRAGELNNLDLKDFDKKSTNNEIKKYANLNFYDSDNPPEEISLEKGQELLENLTKANMYHLKNADSPFNSADLNRARSNVIKLIHDAEDKARKEDPNYKRSEGLENAISSINTIDKLKTKDRQSNTLNSLNYTAQALGHTEEDGDNYKEALTDDNNELSTLVNTINNRPTKSEYDLVTNTVNNHDIEKFESNEGTVTIKLSGGEEAKLTTNEFIEALDKNYAIIYGDDPDSNEDDKKIDNFRSLFDNWRFNESDNSLAASVGSGENGSSTLDLILNLPEDQQKIVLERLGYKTIDDLIEAISRD
ncbi:MAG: hypothetical protein MK033_10250 [Candidatus Caenarcaniphilales bacterium]|nr:hypothetical protein [Candidatus Caenarcaniphilales bacterium]